ncbi:MAG: 2Fe-2S iron-sulfur cluster binding domain-containing protein [Saccharospirillum sp.]|nr:2Fe-2S iron-sulfur cluster binding domain-containing protein [Saccharospirillum sp.]
MNNNNHDIFITDTGETYSASPEDTLLKGMERLGRKGIPVGCRGGGCGVCKVRILSGQVRKGRMSRDKLSEEEEAAGCVLACRVWAESDVTLAVIGQMGKAVRRKNVAS